jgi:hypothetical protein
LNICGLGQALIFIEIKDVWYTCLSSSFRCFNVNWSLQHCAWVSNVMSIGNLQKVSQRAVGVKKWVWSKKLHTKRGRLPTKKRENLRVQNKVSKARAGSKWGTNLNLRLALALPLFFLYCYNYSLFYHCSSCPISTCVSFILPCLLRLPLVLPFAP